MRKTSIFFLAALFVSFGVQAQRLLFIDSLERSINPVIIIREDVRKMYPGTNLDSIANLIILKTNHVFRVEDFKVFSRITKKSKEQKNIFYMDIPKNTKGVSDTCIKVGIYAEGNKDFYQEINISEDKKMCLDFYSQLGYRNDIHTVHDYSRIKPKRTGAQTYTLKISSKGPNVLVPLGYGLQNGMNCYALYKHEPKGKTRVITLSAKKKRDCYVIKMKFSSKTMKFVLDPISEGYDKVIHEVRIPLKYTKQDLFKASQQINDNVDLFMELNQD